MVSIDDKALLFRNHNMMWLEESGSPSIGDKGFLIRIENGNFFLKETSVSIGNKGRLININGQYYLRSKITEPSTLKWRVNCSSDVHGIKVTSDGVIYAGTDWTATGGAIWAINSDGSIKWCNNDANHPPDCPDYLADIAISDDETGLFVGDTCGWLRRFNTVNGTEIWNWSRKLTDEFYGGLVIDSNDNIYGGTDNEGLVSIDKDGNFRWANSTVGTVLDYHLALDNNQIYVPQIAPCNESNSSKSYNYSWGEGYSTIDLNSGEINWIAGREKGYAVEYYNNRAYYGTYDELDCVTTGGGLIYRYTPIGYYIEDIIIDSNENCYFFESRGSYPNYSTCIKKLDSDGNLIWTKNMTIGHCIQFGPHPMVIDSDNLYIATNIWGTSEGTAFSIKLSNGNVNWSYLLTYDSESGGALSPSEDTYYFGSGQYLYALNI